MEGSRKMVYKSWTAVCSPWLEGGFNVKELLSWNKALLSRWILKLAHATTEGGLWHNWISTYLLKSDTIWTVQCKDSHPESFKNILRVRDYWLQLAGTADRAVASLLESPAAGKFNVSKAYEQLRSKNRRKVWIRSMTGIEIFPYHRIITLLAASKQLATINNIIKRGLPLVNKCSMCKQHAETHHHLFFRCPYSNSILESMLAWMNIPWVGIDLVSAFQWTAKQKHMRHWKSKWLRCSLAATVYFIWKEEM
ncbi:uncharacterized protein LOC141650096 [Silene latifolia]|uniref:uncharacterized protein LOC141650096 n=1 Tax=Silene latifolia TaxID=37657 RepID=UPI003D76D6F0